MGVAINFIAKLLNTNDSVITLELDDIVFSKKHGHEICVMRIVGKNIFPKMTTEEILSNKQAMAGLSKEDLIRITKLHMEIKYNKDKLQLIEINRNGSVLLENRYKERVRYSENRIISDAKLQDKLMGSAALSLGYRFGLKHHINVLRQRSGFINKIVSFFKIEK